MWLEQLLNEPKHTVALINCLNGVTKRTNGNGPILYHIVKVDIPQNPSIFVLFATFVALE